MKSSIYLLLSLFVFCLSVSAPAANVASYECTLSQAPDSARAKVSINPETHFMEVVLDEGTQVKGYASTTFDPTTDTTVYFLQGATQPLSQQLLLTVRNNGQWVQFQRSFSASPFGCR
ncbi:MAG: hypothetical protein EBR01_06140 [Proteobacteria bacterium]|nr:hypothetical protein [Pseudomonadota bacterium]NBY19190.1 hypothetical protein [bacterium]